MPSTSIYSQELLNILEKRFPKYPIGISLSPQHKKGSIFLEEVSAFTNLFQRYSISNALYLIYNNLDKFHSCKICGTEVVDRNRIYCSMKCYKADKDVSKRISEIKSTLYSDNIWKETTEQKKIATMLARYGVEYPMQNLASFEKQKKSSFTNKKIIDNMEMVGYEPIVYSHLLHGTVVRGTDFLKENKLSIIWFDDIGKKHHAYPDFYSDDEESFIEVKSSYTREIDNYKIMKAKDSCNQIPFGYIIATAFPESNKFIIETYLP